MMLKDTRAGGTAQSKECLPYKHEDLSLIFRTHEKKKLKVGVVLWAYNQSVLGAVKASRMLSLYNQPT